MQTMKKVTARNSARELASPKVSRHQKKVSESVEVKERNVTELITSSARKQRVAKKTEDYVAVTNLDGKSRLLLEAASMMVETRQGCKREVGKPRWFRKDEDGCYHYVGGYWDARQKANWEEIPDIFGQACDLPPCVIEE